MSVETLNTIDFQKLLFIIGYWILRLLKRIYRGDLIEATKGLSRDTSSKVVWWQTISQTMHCKRKWYEGYDIESIGGKRAISASKCHVEVAIKLLSIKPSSWNILASAFTASQSYSLLSCHHSWLTLSTYCQYSFNQKMNDDKNN